MDADFVALGDGAFEDVGIFRGVLPDDKEGRVNAALLARLLDLNETQQGVLNIAFKIADDAGLLLLDAKDLRVMLQHVGENAAQFTTQYGNVSAASIGASHGGPGAGATLGLAGAVGSVIAG